MKRYWQFLIVWVICLLAALLWAQPPLKEARQTPGAVAEHSSSAPAAQQPASSKAHPAAADKDNKDKVDGDDPLPGSSSSLPLLAVIGFGVLAGGITSAMRTRE